VDFILFILSILIGIVALAMGFRGLARKAPDEPVYDDETQDGEEGRYNRGYSYTSTRDQNRARKAAWEKELQDLREHRIGNLFWAIGGLVIAAILFAFSATYSQSAGQGVIVTRFGGSIVKADATQGWGAKAPWDTANKWDLFTRDISFSESDTNFETEFEAGEIKASRIATAVASGEDSGARVWFDLDATYNMALIDESPEVIEKRLVKLFKSYRSQDRFTRQVIYPALLNTANTVPSEYTTVEFRGAGSVLAAQKIGELVTDELSDVGITIATTAIKNPDFDKDVEASITKVEQKQQLAEEAKADADAQDVKNEQLIEDAKAKAEAYKEESSAITPELLAKWKIEAYNEGTVFVTQDDSDVILSVPGGKTVK
jgi:regulator of protease activity HflC (stomatin/prohibitin superfamily)